MTAFNEDRSKNRIGKISGRRGRRKDKGVKTRDKDKVELDPIEEKMEDH